MSLGCWVGAICKLPLLVLQQVRCSSIRDSNWISLPEGLVDLFLYLARYFTSCLRGTAGKQDGHKLILLELNWPHTLLVNRGFPTTGIENYFLPTLLNVGMALFSLKPSPKLILSEDSVSLSVYLIFFTLYSQNYILIFFSSCYNSLLSCCKFFL